MQAPITIDEPDEGVTMSGTYSQAELDEAVATAVAPFEAKIKDFEAALTQSELEDRFVTEKAGLESQIAELQAQLDSAVLAAEAAKNEKDSFVAWLEEEAGKEAAALELARIKDERLSLVREVASFPEEYVDANADRWASLSEDDFGALVADWQAIASKTVVTETEPVAEIPTATAMIASREATTGSKSAISEIIGMTHVGQSLRNL